MIKEKRGPGQRFIGILFLVFLLIILTADLLAADGSDSIILNWDKSSSLLFKDTDQGMYNYCPSIIQTDSNTRYVYYCSNRDSYLVRDFIYYRKGVLEEGKWKWSAKKIALRPAEEGWDKVHVCDPDLVKGVFKYREKIYSYALFYLGVDVKTSTHNQIGVAFSNSPEGPWIRYSENPIVKFSRYSYWGVGQPSVYSINKEGKVLIFYTRGDNTGNHFIVRKLDFSNMDNPLIGEGTVVTAAGLKEIDGSRPSINNAAIVHDEKRALLFMVRERHPYPEDKPDFISSQVQLAVISDEAFENGQEKWKVLKNIGSEETGKPRNHNASIVKNAYGNLYQENKLEIALSIADAVPGSLWSYRVHKIEADIITDN